MDIINDVYCDLIKCYQTRNFQFDFSTSEMYIDEYLNGVYIHYEALYRAEFDELVNNEVCYFDKQIPCHINQFKKKYMEYMDTYCSKKRKTRYGIMLTLLYPKKIQTDVERRKFVREYIKAVSGINCDLPYFVTNYRQGNGVYAKVIIIERLYLGKTKWRIYKRDQYIDTRTGRFASKTCSEKFKKIVCRAGDYVLDKNGNKIPASAMFSNNLRIFSFAKDSTSKENLWRSFLYKMRLKYIDTVLLVCGKVNLVKKGKRLHKTNNKPEYHRYVRRRISTINYAKQVIEYTTNYILNKACKNDIVYEPYNYGKDNVIKHSNTYKQVISIFMKYKSRFHKNVFHDEFGVERRIDYYDMRVDELDKNIEILIEMFFKELKFLEI